jgi:two-component sensor histidine kinase
VRGEKVTLGPSAAQNINLAIHELTTNAHKHGVLAGEDGTITVEWTRSVGGKVTLSWTEQGATGTKPPAQPGFGTQILQTLFEDAKLDFTPAGLRFSGSLQVR